jgi:uncharacterized protein (DUF305 family)
MVAAAATTLTWGGAQAQVIPSTVQPGAPGDSARVLTGEELGRIDRAPHTPADVRFMRGMIAHHIQALEMTELVSQRTRDERIRLLARRIELSQADEIALMQRWLRERGEQAPHGHPAHGHSGGAMHAEAAHPEHESMPGMLTKAQMSALAAATGEAFDRLFLEGMIHHHEGALVMVAELFREEGAGHEGEIFQFASHVDADQRMEIARMQRMLAAKSVR